jgi:hypothetical protein
MPIQTNTMHSKDWSEKKIVIIAKYKLKWFLFIIIHYLIEQISPNLFKVDATTLQRATYKSSMMLNEVSSLWFIENLQIPFKLMLSIFLYILTFFKALVCQIFTIPMGWVLNDVQQHVIKYWSHFC